tara:strand:+ start:3797 stop:3985 length:189 start_codon:yes stop_codon:yes gene_type:complete
MSTRITAKEALLELKAHTKECSMYRLGVNARLRRMERIIYCFIGLVLADYFQIFTAIKGFAQ